MKLFFKDIFVVINSKFLFLFSVLGTECNEGGCGCIL